MVQKLAFALAVEDDHRHLARAKAAREILRNDVFKEGGLAGARSAYDYSVLDPHGIRPAPWLFMHVVSEKRSRILVRIVDNSCVFQCRDCDGRMRPVFFSLLSSPCEMSYEQASAKEHDGAIKEDFQALVVV